MDLKIIILIFILSFIFNFIFKKYIQSTMILVTMSMLAIIIAIVAIGVTICIYLFSLDGISWNTSLMLITIFIFLLLILFFCSKEYITLTIKILDYRINRNKILERGYIEKGIILEIKSYGFHQRRLDGYYLIVDFNGEKIKSMPFRFNGGGTIIKTTYKSAYNEGRFNKDKTEEILGDMPQLYNIGDEIDVIIYNNKKYVKLKEYEYNKFF